MDTRRRETHGMLLGVLGVAIFSLTLPTTRLALAELDAYTLFFGRIALAALPACALLLITRQKRPTARQLRDLALVVVGVIIGFPLFSILAMETVPASHGGVVIGILPLATAMAGTLFTADRPSLGFWLTGALGSALVVAFALLHGGAGGFAGGDLFLLLAIVAAAMGYAVGAHLSQELGGWQTISWALALSLVPAAAGFVLNGSAASLAAASLPSWLCFLYLAFFSQFLGFFAWYRGLAMGGIARVGQTQLLQPFLTLLAAAFLLAEPLEPLTAAFAALVVGVVAIGRRMPVRRAVPAQAS